MKTIKMFALMLGLFCYSVSGVYAQSTEVQQLLLNVEKLSQLKNILGDMKKGYQVVSGGYSAIKNISQGNFSLHEVFIDGLSLVSPEIKKYGRIKDIITDQASLVSEYKRALKSFSASGLLNAGELDYLGRIFKSLLDKSVDQLDELAMILTSSKLRMSDAERLKGIDRIFERTAEQLQFLRSFNSQANILILQRQSAMQDTDGMNQLFNLK